VEKGRIKRSEKKTGDLVLSDKGIYLAAQSIEIQ
jgi:hypothetical protein